jgi:microcystin-dependent protein
MDSYIGEIRMFAGYYAPEDWAFCDGSLLSVNSYQALFSLLGTQYGGDGVNTFGVPDLRSRIPVGMGQGTGLTNYIAGQTGGQELVVLSQANMPLHTHTMMASSKNATQLLPTNAVYATVPPVVINGTTYGELYASPTTVSYSIRDFDQGAVANFGSNSAVHENRMPTMPINFIISLVGIYPTHN